MTNKTFQRNDDLAETVLKSISSQDFLEFGVQHVAYVRPVMIQGERIFAIHAADGTPLSVSESFESAIMAVRENDMEPVTVH